MLGTRYVVDIDIVTSRRVDGDLGRLEGRVGSLGAAFGKVGGRFLDGFTGAVESIGAKVSSLAKLGLAAGVAAATYGVVGLNSELETTKVSLAAVLNANNLTGSVEEGMQRAAGWAAQMKKDAKDLPGEFRDLLYIVQSGAGAAFNAGLDDVQFEKLAARGMAAAKALSVDMHQAGREMAMLFEGRAGAHNVFGTRLGIRAEGFNKQSDAERVRVITEALTKFEPAIKVFGQTFDAQSSTFVDNLKSFGGRATKPLFDGVVRTLGRANDWVENNGPTVDLWADKIGIRLGRAFDEGVKFAEEWGPRFVTFAGNFYDRFTAAWREVQPYVKAFGEVTAKFLESPESIDKLITLGKIYAGVKLAQGFGNMGGFDILGGGGKWAAGKLGAMAGGGAAAAAGGAVDAAAAAEWAAALKAASFSGKAGSAIGAAGAGTTVLIGGVVTATLAALAASGYEIYDANRRLETVDARGGGAYGYSSGERKYVDEMVDKGIRAGEAIGKLGDATLPMIAGFDQLSESAGELQFIIRSLAKSGDFEAIARINAGLDAKRMEAAFAQQETDRATDFFNLNSAAMGIQAIQKLDEQAQRDKDREKKRKESLAGRGGININKVEITVSSNQAPGQIARDVFKEMVNRRRFRTSSPVVNNFGAGR